MAAHLEHADAMVGRSATQALSELAEMGDQHITAVAACLEDAEWLVGEWAVQALSKLAERATSVPSPRWPPAWRTQCGLLESRQYRPRPG